MIDILLPGDKTNQPQQTAVMYMVNRAAMGRNTDLCGFGGRINRPGMTGDKFKPNPLHPLGRHPFNIITEEIYD